MACAGVLAAKWWVVPEPIGTGPGPEVGAQFEVNPTKEETVLIGNVPKDLRDALFRLENGLDIEDALNNKRVEQRTEPFQIKVLRHDLDFALVQEIPNGETFWIPINVLGEW